MAKTTGGIRAAKSGRGLVGDSRTGSKPRQEYPLSDIKNEDVFRETKQAISKFEGKMGIKTREVRLADLSGALGVAVSTSGGPVGVYLDKDFYQNTERNMAKAIRESYKRGFISKTNKPIQHVITHELSHTVWTNHFTSKKHLSAGKEIRKLYRVWRRDKKGGLPSNKYGRYAGTNINEFVAETLTKGTIGTSDKYTRKLISIVKKYKL